MINKELRQRDILRLIAGLDITPTMFKNATEKYKSVAVYLQEQGLFCDIFPQGSFSLGTVVRPYLDAKEANYDLDFICSLNCKKDETEAKKVKNIVKKILCRSDVYKSKLQNIEWDCSSPL